MSHILKSKLFFALSISIGVLVLHGFSFFAIAACLYAAGTALVKGPRTVTYSAFIFGGVSLLFADNSQGSAMLMMGAVIAVVLSDSAVSRYLFFLSAAAILFDGAIQGILPLTAALLVASHVKRVKLRTIILAGGVFAVLIFSGLPSAREQRILVLQEVMSQGAVIWPARAELNLSMPELILQAPGTTPSRLTVTLHGGGVRDNDPVGYITSDDRTFPLYSGENILVIEQPEFPVSIRISRSWKPFFHPVIHFDSAEASF